MQPESNVIQYPAQPQGQGRKDGSLLASGAPMPIPCPHPLSPSLVCLAKGLSIPHQHWCVKRPPVALR